MGQTPGSIDSGGANQVKNDFGVTAVMVAISLFVLMGMAALALDGGRVYAERRSAQNAADQSAVTAAYTECSGGDESAAIAAGVASADLNGFNDDGVTNDVVITRNVEYEYRSTVNARIDGLFARLLGADELSTFGTAVASCTPGEVQGEALFANGSGCPDPEIEISGNNLTVNGGAHSNEDVTLTGEGHVIEGSTGYVPPGAFTDTGSTNSYSETTTSPQPYPIDFQITDYRPGGSVASAAGTQYFDVSLGAPAGTSWNGSKWQVGDGASLPPGIYYSPGEIEVGNNVTVQAAAGGQNDGITFVAEDKILFKDNSNFTSWGGSANQDLVVFSNHPGADSCTETAVELNGNTNVFGGIILAKHGIADVQGNSASAFGGVWGYRVIIHANSFAVTGPLVGVGGDPEVSLLE